MCRHALPKEMESHRRWWTNQQCWFYEDDATWEPFADEVGNLWQWHGPSHAWYFQPSGAHSHTMVCVCVCVRVCAWLFAQGTRRRQLCHRPRRLAWAKSCVRGMWQAVRRYGWVATCPCERLQCWQSLKFARYERAGPHDDGGEVTLTA